VSISQGWPDQPPVQVQVIGDNTPEIAEYADRRIREAFGDSRLPILHARVRVTRHTNPARARPVVAQANLDVNGRLVRAQYRAQTAYEAIDLLHDRLRRRLHDLLQRPGDPAAMGTWRAPAEDTGVGDGTPSLPPARREIVRHKTVTPLRQSVTEAAEFMDDMSYDFHLFTESDSGQDSVLYRSTTGYRLAQLDPPPQPSATQSGTVTVSDQPASRMSVPEAVERMNVWTQPFLFFRNSENDRGALLYLRHDGHYGLITPETPRPEG
jgi:ribosome-associated translation inhibitor RaiA